MRHPGSVYDQLIRPLGLPNRKRQIAAGLLRGARERFGSDRPAKLFAGGSADTHAFLSPFHLQPRVPRFGLKGKQLKTPAVGVFGVNLLRPELE
jgi:hypothetical protein